MTGRPLSRQLALAWGAVAIAGLALAPLVAKLVGRLPACPLRAASGWPCPACGSGRALVALAAGDLAGALAANPLLLSAATLFALAGLAAAGAELAGRPLVEPRTLPGWARVAAPLALVANWLYLVGSGR